MSKLQSGVELRNASAPVSSSKEKRIPVHIRFVPRDVWIRMHINTGSTIGAVKDAALERLDLPPLDPTILPDFYEIARNVNTKPAQRVNEARTFPKAFLARRPKSSLAELLATDSAMRKESSQSMKAAFISSPSRIRSRKKDATEVAKQILGSDPGESAMGSLGYVSSQSPDKLAEQRSMESLSGDVSRGIENSRVLSSPSSSSNSSRFINSVKGATGPKARASMASLSAAVKAVHRAASSRDLHTDLTDIIGQDTYSDYIASGLPGNTEAKRREEEAMTTLKRSDFANAAAPSSPSSKQYPGPFQDGIKTSSSGSQSIASSSNDVHQTVDASIDQTALDLDYSSSLDNESDHSASNTKILATTKNLLSSESDLSSGSHLERHASPGPSSPVTAVAGLKTGREGMQSQTMADFVATSSYSPVSTSPAAPTRQKATSTSLSINPNTERGRSGTIIAPNRESRKGKMPIEMIRSYSDQSAQSGVYENIKGSISNTEMNRTVTHRRSQELPRASCDGSLTRSQKIAGIRLDEISSWKEARHAMSHHFTTYSYSNGNMLEDWRTVAAFKIRPFELLEIHYANPYERIYLPRDKQRTEDLLHRSSSATLLDAQSEASKADPYIEPRSEAWCYIFKPNSGPGKAQRAGLGVWKLRFIIVRDNLLIICRKKSGKGNGQGLQDADIWPLDMIDCIWTEKAKGGTQPFLASLKGECQDLLTFTMPASAAPDGSTLVSNYGDVPSANLSQFASLSMRFISQSDCRAFYNTFARALQSTISAQTAGKSAWVNEWRKKVITRSTIAGMGGVVLPSKIGKKKGRNAMARSRSRPPGVSRAFDDADQWSSHSENEDHGKVKSIGSAFSYAYLHIDTSKDLSINPAFEMEPLVKTTSIQSSLAPISPKTTRVNLSVADEMEYRAAFNRAATATAIMTTTSIVTATPERNTPKAERRSRGFSLAKVARRVVTPNVDRNAYRGGTNSAPSFDDNSSRKGSRKSTAIPSDYGEQDIIHHIARSTPGSPNKDQHHQYHHKEEENKIAPPRTPIRTSSQSHAQSNRSGPTTPSSLSSPRRDVTSIDSARGTRHRSQTVVQGPSTIPTLPPSPNHPRRSVDLRQNSFTTPSSSSTVVTTTTTTGPKDNTSSHHHNVFHWPFRNPSQRASTTARSALHKELAE